MIETNDKNFQKDVMECSTPVLVDFWAPWCGPCKAMNPVLDELASEFAGKLKIVKLNIDDNQEVANQFGIRSIPNFMIVANGVIKSQTIGAVGKAKLTKEIENVLK